MSSEEVYVTVATLSFIVLDYLSGVLAAALRREITSSNMKIGLSKKLVYIVIMVTCYVIDVVSAHVNLGFTTALYVIVSVGVCLIEITSIFENCLIINPKLRESHIFDFLKKSHENSNKSNKVMEENNVRH